MENRLILVTGATGYVGGRLVPRLIEKGYAVRVLVRDPARLAGRRWREEVDVVRADVLDIDSLRQAMVGVSAAYYLIHSMSGNQDFHERDLKAAENFGTAAREQDVERIIYLGGLGDPESNLSDHLRSRHETGAMLRDSGVPVTELRAGVIVGSGSISFEMIRYLTERIPLMICPRWVYTRTQPIAVRDALAYLIAALETPESVGRSIEIGGADQLSYRNMILTYARQRGLKRLLIPLPILGINLSSWWFHVVSPVPAGIARPLVKGLRNEAVVRNDLARSVFPDIKPITYEHAVALALDRLAASEVETRWSDALASSQGDVAPVVLTSHEGMLIEQRQRDVDSPAEAIFKTFTGLGGKRGWLSYNWAWKLRGLLDTFVGGVGFRRGRRHPDKLRVGDALDFWRVEAIEENRLLRLRAEMRVPGRAWLQFKVEPLADGRSRLTQTAFFAPKGLFGYLYWYVLYPIHGLIFSSLIRLVAEHATRIQTAESSR